MSECIIVRSTRRAWMKETKLLDIDTFWETCTRKTVQKIGHNYDGF